MRVAVDAMGGDFGPSLVVPASVKALDEEASRILFVGQQAEVTSHLDALSPADRSRCELVEAPDVVEMSDTAAASVRRKPKSSLAVGLKLVKAGEADGFVSAGHSGAVMTGALAIIGRVRGVDRPALVTVLPTLRGRSMLLDLGATTDPRPQYLVQYAIMAVTYARLVMGVAEPRVGLLSNGEERSKGNQLVQEVFPLLEAVPGINFIGNVEGKELLRGDIEVFVTDGFTGNIALKSMEGAIGVLTDILKEEVTRTPMRKAMAILMRPALRQVRTRLDYEEIGGAPLLGVNGSVIVAHGRSRERAIANAVRVAARTAAQDIPAEIERAIAAASIPADSAIPAGQPRA
jgi:glycerol-3-phosphate acyltransferase PlsX